MKPVVITFAIFAAGAAALAGRTRPARDTTRVRVVAQPAPGATLYVGSRAPLLPSALVKLPIGSIRPEGWVREQLRLEAEGFIGRLPEISSFCQFKGSAWTSPTGAGKLGWEEVPYWLKGFTDLGYVLRDPRIIRESNRWIDAILASQRPDGYFGPESNRKTPDIWPNMLVLYALRSHYEATGDARVLPFMTRYFRWQAKLPLDRFLPGDWQKWRGGDNLDSIYWLYDHTGDPKLLDLARVCHERTADWVGGIPTWHGVNICQGWREPAEYYQQTRDPRYLAASVRDLHTVLGLYGQAPGGMFGADENARRGYNGPRQGTETCSMVEMMFSDEMLLGITGDPSWADRCEEVAFNQLPAAMTPDLKGLHYLTAPNMVQLDRQSKAPMIENGGDMLSYDPHSYRCCQHNAGFGWPYYAERLWMAAPNGGLAAAFYAPSEVTAKVAGGGTATVRETTEYPFGEGVSLTVEPSKTARFPLLLRVPGWCAQPKLSVNGAALALPPHSQGWIELTRAWHKGDRVRLELPMAVRVKTWTKDRDTVSVYRGPLAYSLMIGERWQPYGSDTKWPRYEVFPTTPWNYGLELAPGDPTGGITMEQRVGKLATQPFTLAAAPIRLRAKGRRIPGWKLEANGLIGKVQPGPIRSDQPLETLTLVPMGCARLRVSAFPQIGRGPDARDWDAASVDASASTVHDTLAALNDGVLPSSSSDESVPRFTWWDHLGTTEWVQYAFGKARRVAGCRVYWFDDGASGGQCRTPASWRLLYRDASGAWQPVPDASGYGTAKDGWNAVKFALVETTALRLEAKLRPGFSGGILEWALSVKR